MKYIYICVIQNVDKKLKKKGIINKNIDSVYSDSEGEYDSDSCQTLE